MGTGKHLVISQTGFPGTNKTWRFIQSAWREPLEALAKLSGNKTILTGLTTTVVGGVTNVSNGFISYNGEILPFEGGVLNANVTLVEDIENVTYDVDVDNDGELDILPAYKTRYLKFGTDGIESFSFSDLTILKSIKELSEFELPEGIVIDPEYVHTDNNFTTILLEKLNGIQSGAEVNVQADWNMESPASDAFVKNKPFKSIVFAYGSQTVLNSAGGDYSNDYTKNYIYVYPPTGYTIANLAGFMPSIGRIQFSGDVNSDDRLWCRYQVQTANSRIVAICSNSETSAPSIINYIAIWKK